MTNESLAQRQILITAMFTALSKGNYSYRIVHDERRDYIDALIVFLNFIAGEFEAVISDPDSFDFPTLPAKISLDPVMHTRHEVGHKIHQYILTHLDDPLPSQKHLSHMFHTNENTLKREFRASFGISIYKFYNQQRLQRAQVQILSTAAPLKDIAFGCGFSSYAHFSKAYKKYFGYAPGTLRMTP